MNAVLPIDNLIKQAERIDPHVYWADVDPTLAADWLRRNGKNRPKKPANIERYTAAMASGEWKVTGAPIQFGKSGQLVDGQNRLQAIIDSGAAVRMLVVDGVDDEVFDVIDGNAKRTGSDMLHIEGYEGWLAQCGSTAASVASSLMSKQAPYSTVLTTPAIRRFVLLNPDLMTSVEFLGQLPRKGVPLVHSGGAALHFLMSKKDAYLADLFMRRLYTGEGLSSVDMLLKLRNSLVARLMDVGANKQDNVRAMFGVVKVWNATRAGRTIKHINNAFPNSGDAFPEIA